MPTGTTFFTPEIWADVDYVYDFNHAIDDSIGGSSEVCRSSEVHVTPLGVGDDFHYDHVGVRHGMPDLKKIENRTDLAIWF